MFKNKLIPATLMALALVGCNSSDSGSSSIQAAHASKDAPLANVWLNGSPQWTNVDFATASGFSTVTSGLNTVRVDVQLPGGETTTVISDTALSLNELSKYTVVVVGEADSTSSNSVEALVLSRPASGNQSSSSLDVQVAHAAAGVPDVDLYVTSPGADLSTSTAQATLSYKNDSGVLNIPGGDYQIRLALAGTQTVAFDSGTVSLANNSELTIAAVPNADSDGSSPVKLLVMDGSSSSVIYNATESAEIQVGHLVDDAPRVDVSLNGTEAVSDLDFKDVRDYTAVTSGTYDIDVYVDNTPASVVIDVNGQALDKGMDYGIFAVNELASIEGLIIETDRRPVATSAKLNVIHAAPSASTVDVYLTETSDITSASPAISGFDFKEDQQGVYVAAGTYFVTVTPTGTKTAAIGPASVTVENDKVYQAIAIDDGVATFDLIVNDITD
jgi:hypothetical protein